MKIPILAVLSLGAIALQAQPATSVQEQQERKGGQEIREPAGAQLPGQDVQQSQQQPQARAFSDTNAPEGRPFQEGAQGRPFRTNESGSRINEPSGAQPQTSPEPQVGQPQSQSQQNSSQSQPGTQQSQQSSQSGQQGLNDPAGAQRGGAERLSTALGSLKGGGPQSSTQLHDAIRACFAGGKNVPNQFVDRLSTDLSRSFTRINIVEAQRVQFANALDVILTAQSGNQAQIEQALGTVQTILIQSGTPIPDARVVACDLHLIATELVPNLQLTVPTPAASISIQPSAP